VLAASGNRFHKVVKSSEEMALEAALLAQAEWKQAVHTNKQALAREQMAKKLSRKLAKRALTIPETPNFASRPAATKKGPEKSAADAKDQFKARPMPNFAAMAAQGISHVKTRPCTVPKSPNFSTIRPKAATAAQENAHVSVEEVNKYYRTMRGESSAQLSSDAETFKNRPKVTVPVAPRVATGYSSGPAKARALTTKEAADLAEAEAHQFKARPLNSAVFQGCGSAGVPAVKTRPPTQPKPFAIKGEANPAPKRAATAPQPGEAVGFKARPAPKHTAAGPVETGRRASVSSTRPLTVPRSPTMGSKSRRATISVAPAADENASELANSFHAQPIPDYGALSGIGINANVARREPTRPVSPNISHSTKRTPPPAPVEERDFHAQPMPDYAALGTQGINTNVKPRPLTAPKPFNISAPVKRAPAPQAEEEHEFHAQPMPDYGALSGIGINANVARREPTRPVSPNISESNRVARKAGAAEDEHQFKARPVPSGATRSGAGLSMPPPRPLTVPEPFALPGDAHSVRRKAQAEAERAREVEAAAAARESFRAARAPDWSTTCFIPQHSTKELTEFDDFTLPGQGQHDAAMAAHAVRLEEEKRQLADAASSFHALPLPPTTFAPGFVAQRSERPPLAVVATNIGAAGEKRAADRKAYNAAQMARVEAEAAARVALVAKREAEADAEYKARMEVPVAAGGLKFLARPVHASVTAGPDFVPEPSAAPLTAPVTPGVLKHATHTARTASNMVGGALRVPAN